MENFEQWGVPRHYSSGREINGLRGFEFRDPLYGVKEVEHDYPVMRSEIAKFGKELWADEFLVNKADEHTAVATAMEEKISLIADAIYRVSSKPSVKYQFVGTSRSSSRDQFTTT